MQSSSIGGGGGGAAYSISLDIPTDMLPLTLAFVVYVPPHVAAPASSTASGKGISKAQYVTPLQGRHFSVLLGSKEGRPAPLGGQAWGRVGWGGIACCIHAMCAVHARC
jgi:hypothetical protein